MKRRAGNLLWIWAAANCVMCTPRIPRVDELLEFRDADWQRGKLLGHVVFEAPAVTPASTYRLYLGLNARDKYTPRPLTIWQQPNARRRFTHVIAGPIPRHATHWLVYAVDDDGQESGSPLALQIADQVRASAPYELLPISTNVASDARPVAVYRNRRAVRGASAALLRYLDEHVDFSTQSVLQVNLTAACPGDWGIQLLGLHHWEQRLEVHVHVWSTNEMQAACHRQYWIVTGAVSDDTSVAVVPFSECIHPMYDCNADASARLHL